jgi:hypothetical protein
MNFWRLSFNAVHWFSSLLQNIKVLDRMVSPEISLLGLSFSSWSLCSHVFCDCRCYLTYGYRESTWIRLGPHPQLTECIIVINLMEICQKHCPVWSTIVTDAISLGHRDQEKTGSCRRNDSGRWDELINVVIVTVYHVRVSAYGWPPVAG